MHKHYTRYLINGLLFPILLMQLSCSSTITDARTVARPLLYNFEKMTFVKEQIATGQYEYMEAYYNLLFLADSSMNVGPFTVVNTGKVPPSGDQHDYSSMSPYWWPDSSKKDGLPYINRDGVVNPERNSFDKIPFAALGESVTFLSLAYYYSGQEKYAERASYLLKTWFFDPDHKMNPNLTYGQFIPGRSRVRGVGIIESRVLMYLAEASILLEPSSFWNDKDHVSMVDWYSQFLDWLLTSENGIDERIRKNNHGSWYDAQTAYLALFTGRNEIAIERFESIKDKRISTQIADDGRQPFELVRTKTLNYTVFNLLALTTAAELAKNIGIDIWNYSTEDGRNIELGLNFLVKNAIEEGPWPFKQITNIGFHEGILRLLLLADQNLEGKRYLNALYKLPVDKVLSSKELLVTGNIDLKFPLSSDNIELPSLFSNNMVLQRGAVITISGASESYRRLKIEFAGNIEFATSEANGNWEAGFKNISPGGPYTLTVTGRDTLEIGNILVGDVWVCSGQSNMDMPVGGWGQIYKFQEVVDKADNADIRLFKVPRNMENKPTKFISDAKWLVSSPENVEEFSAVGYLFGKEINETQGIPVGIIQSAWGGTNIEAWMSTNSFESFPDYKDLIEDVKGSSDSIDTIIQNEYKNALKDWRRRAENLRDSINADNVKPEVGLLPDYWENWADMNLFDGAVSFSKSIAIPENWVGNGLVLNLTVTDDYDRAFFNNVEIGRNDRKNNISSYQIPADLVKQGVSTLRVEVIDLNGRGGIWGDVIDLNIGPSDSDNISLAGEWQYKKIFESSQVGPLPDRPYLHKRPTVLYNGMIEPLVDYPITGIIWYQGESNASKAEMYEFLFPAMIVDWRKHWNQEIPFFYVQLANWDPLKSTSTQTSWSELREAQRRTLSIPMTGMAIAIDLGDKRNIHPKNKQDVAHRLALLARNQVYGDDISSFGPEVLSFSIEGSEVRLNFDHVYDGLDKTNDALFQSFELSGIDNIFYTAEMEIFSDHIELMSDSVEEPVFVRYNWSKDPKGNLINSEKLPASPFLIKLTDPLRK